jgi:hypothetical protein
MINLWNLILSAIMWVITQTVLPLFPSAGPVINFTMPMIQGFVIFLQLSLVFFSIFNLWWFGAYLVFALLITGIKQILNIFSYLKSLLPMLIRLFVG